jgi:hypothetical protein
MEITGIFGDRNIVVLDGKIGANNVLKFIKQYHTNVCLQS